MRIKLTLNWHVGAFNGDNVVDLCVCVCVRMCCHLFEINQIEKLKVWMLADGSLPLTNDNYFLLLIYTRKSPSLTFHFKRK